MLKLARLNGQPEIFHSIQGEGKSIGRPSVFIRLSLCNLYCAWCDTDYTWNWEGTAFTHNNDVRPGYRKYRKEEYQQLISNEEIRDRLAVISCSNLIFTGGEPLVQQKDLRSLFRLLKENNPDYHIEFETNGTLKPLPEIDALTDQYNVSVKLANSKVAPEDRLNPEAIRFFAASPKANFKFVVDSRADLDEVLALVQGYGIRPEAVYLMPQGTSAAALREKQAWVAELCKQYNYNYTDRLHIHIWGDKRGV
ncbi:7-carboxy-7-deazaguanine synthase QueE [Flaviaesturariibacter flavus]|uniref:7-carboxy-7-deazaguanine synthase n=1 Tax=Flaviaesturariibacter flavus TaxID=2502780 RepID=A0A4R1BBL2_9BACT|nr:7-carboxy-7-deazaguanine synthase QueE [Flaviaesturariibacter flavus]TCJ14389.1 7-carboxy-7-deazaguanine synthase QueE [Flaviaesturariibacter flavus]